jgi:tetratricopeptide (TPR) repeat protein
LLLNCRDFVQPVVTLVVAASLLHSPIVLASDQPQTSVQQGIAAYEAGEYRKALEYFAHALRLGSKKIGLYYNIGVAHYKLGEYEEADKAFKKVSESPKWESLALYNRALIAYRRNQLDLAKKFAKKSISLSKSPRLTALNYRLLDTLENKGSDKSDWSELILFGLGFNDNVVLSEAGASAISGIGDTYYDLTGRVKRAFTSKNSKKQHFLLQASLRDYAKLNEYDQIGLRSGFEKELGRPNGTLGAYLEHVSLDGKSYELVTSLEYRQTITNKNNSPEFRYYFTNYSILDSDYAYLGGVRHRFRLATKNKLEKGLLKTYIQTDYNDREDQNIMGNFYSYSPVSLGIGTVYTKNLSHRRVMSGLLYLQQSHFLDPDKRLGVFKTREDGYLEFRLRFAHVSPTRWVYRASYTRTINDSNYSEYSYNQNIVSFDIFKSF